jgi:gamma-glutamylcyclotransferase (GGCT)/AIG2-like uncharacterized protein YtfP
MPERLFCYGTLQIPAVMRAVVGRRPRGFKACLPGYAAYRVRGAEYPGVLAAPGQSTPGILYRQLSLPELQTLDRFEGALYVRRHIPVRLADGRRCQAWIYLLARAKTRHLSRQRWLLLVFRRTLAKRFMNRFVWARRTAFLPPATQSANAPPE